MTKKRSICIALACLFGFIVATVPVLAQDYPTIKYRKAADHVGDIVWVEGKILKTEKTSMGMYLLFSANKKYLRILVPANNLANFTNGVNHYAGKKVKAVGKITEYGDFLVLGVNEPKRLKVVQ